MTSAFESLSGPGKALRAEPPDKREFEGLIRSGHARLNDALNTSLSIESRFDLAYNAAHALCLAAYVGMAIAPAIGMLCSSCYHIP